MYLPPQARFQALLELPEGANVGQAINDAMKAIENENEELRGVLPRTYDALSNSTLVALLRNVNSIQRVNTSPGDGVRTARRLSPEKPGNARHREMCVDAKGDF